LKLIKQNNQLIKSLRLFKKIQFNNYNNLVEKPSPTKNMTEWQIMKSKYYLMEDLNSGLLVATVALPLCLAISIASGVPAYVGLITSVLGAIFCTLNGGSKIAISGPAAALSVIVSTVVMKFGFTGLLISTMICGVLQFCFGLLKYGTLIKLVPITVVEGFTAGIGGIILVSQLPKIFGIKFIDPKLFDFGSSIQKLQLVLNHIIENGVYMPNLSISILALSLIFLIRLIKPLYSFAPILSISISTCVNSYFKIGATVIGKIPSLNELASPLVYIENISNFNLVPEMIFYSLLMFGILSIETLLTATTVDKIMLKKYPINRDNYLQKHDSNTELRGQGIGNIIIPLFGGLPVTCVIVRSVLNVTSGARTKRAAIIHSFILFSMVAFLSPIISLIPHAALSALLATISFRMLNINQPIHIYNISKLELIPFLITFFTIVSTDLLTGVGAGFISQICLVLYQRNRSKFNFQTIQSDNLLTINIDGSIDFLSSQKISLFEIEFKKIVTTNQNIIIDFKNLKSYDISGIEQFFDILFGLQYLYSDLEFKNVSKEFQLFINNVHHELKYNNSHKEQNLH